MNLVLYLCAMDTVDHVSASLACVLCFLPSDSVFNIFVHTVHCVDVALRCKVFFFEDV